MITIVSGLPRSGTSLMMQILNDAGYDIFSDGVRLPDENNLKGYFEYERVKALAKDNSWMSEAEGKTIKIIAQLLQYVPDLYQYRIIYMERNMDEIINSQNKMLSRLNIIKPFNTNDVLKNVYSRQTENILKVMAAKPNVQLLKVSYNGLIEKEKFVIKSLINFSENKITESNILNCIDKSLYRERNN